MLEVQNLRYIYRATRQTVLQDLNLTLQRGEILALIGKNGSGKSTLARLIAGINPLQSGRILLDHQPINNRHRRLLSQKISIVFQNPEHQIIFNNLHDELSFMLPHQSPNEFEARIDEVLALVDMAVFKHANLYDLSLGQKQRIVIAEALLRQPHYLILDEPTTMIDGLGKIKIHQIIQKLSASGVGILLITNQPDEILLAHRIAILANGKISKEFPRSDLLENFSVFAEHGFASPALLQLINTLNHRTNTNLRPQNWTITEIAELLVERLNRAQN